MTGSSHPDDSPRAEGGQPRRPWTIRVLGTAAVLLLLTLVADEARLRRERENLRSRSAELAGRLQSAETELARRAPRARVLESDDVRMLLLTGRDPQPGARGLVCWSPKARHGILVASGLARLPEDRQYQLWVVQGGRPRDAGVFDVDPGEHALFESKEFDGSGPETFQVTVEPRGGASEPTGPVVLLGSPA